MGEGTPVFKRKQPYPQGHATVQVLARGYRLRFEDDAEQIDEREIMIAKDGLADESVKLANMRYFIRLNREKSKIYNVAPPDDSYYLRFIGFAHKKGEPPTPKWYEPKTFENDKGGTWTRPGHNEFTAQLAVVEGPYRGLTTAINFWYTFAEYEGGIAAIDGYAKRAEEVENFLRFVGFDFATDKIPYSLNVLPALERILLSKGDEMVLGKLENGWCQELSNVPSGHKAEAPRRRSTTKAPAKPKSKK